MKQNTVQPMKQSHIKIRQLFPNAITMTALGFGVSSLNMAFWGQWKLAVLFIALSALFDFLDGGVARLLGVESKFGAQLDSLSDFVSFGVAPGFLMYQWTMDQDARYEALIGNAYRADAVGIYWGFALFLAMCAAMRLARFNAMLEESHTKPQPPYWQHFFMGVPAPAGAGLAILPLVLWLACDVDFFRNPWFVGFFLVFSGAMMASRIPTLCLKHLNIPEHFMTPLRIGLLFILASLLAFPWISLSVIGVCYLISIPLGIRYFLQQKNSHAKG